MNRKAELIIDVLENAGFIAGVVGGAVRDKLIGKEQKDVDIVTNALPEQIKKLFLSKGYSTTGVGEKFGIMVVVIDHEPFEIASFRSDGKASDGRRPTDVKLGSSIDDDLARRDFTMNSIFMKRNGELYDPHDGALDIKNKIVKFVGDPIERIFEDQLRILRAFRFMSQLDFKFHSDTKLAIETWAETESFGENISQERITAEFSKIMTGQNVFETIKLMAETGILWMIIPELKDQLQPHNNDWHHEQVAPFGNSILAHTLLVIKKAITLSKDLSVMMAAILHDVGKPACREQKADGKSRFLGHDKVGAKMTVEIMTRMKFPSEVVKATAELVFSHMNAHDLGKMKDVAKIRKFIGRPDLDNLMALSRSDEEATLSNSPRVGILTHLKKWTDIFGTELPKPIITGNDLIAAGVKPNDKFKGALETAFNQQLRGVEDKKKLLNQALSYISSMTN